MLLQLVDLLQLQLLAHRAHEKLSQLSSFVSRDYTPRDSE
jgi:hypothetical protein